MKLLPDTHTLTCLACKLALKFTIIITSHAKRLFYFLGSRLIICIYYNLRFLLFLITKKKRKKKKLRL